ncbi:MAG: lipid-A-disaccharide synthase N-terminal domain-containing protein [Planctomycetes bacterium]|nr:lipid-A-disaccharide synthase N-terminal domain-containing protein [Planctomycetota bacterium]
MNVSEWPIWDWGPWKWTALVGQVLFFGRVMVQWVASERERRSANPPLFWWISLGGSLCLSAATLGLGEWLLLPSYLVNTAIYARNLRLHGERGSRLGPVPAALAGLGAAAVLMGVAWAQGGDGTRADVALPWLVAGLAGQAIWATRFLVQWWLSERAGHSHFPPAFWWLCLTGSLLNLAYTLAIGEAVFWIGFVGAWVAPARNLMLEYGHRRRTA